MSRCWRDKRGEFSAVMAGTFRLEGYEVGKLEEDVEAPPVPTPEPTECVGPECEIPGPTGAEEPGVGAEPGPAEPAPAEPAPAEPAPAEPAPAEPGPPEPQPTP